MNILAIGLSYYALQESWYNTTRHRELAKDYKELSEEYEQSFLTMRTYDLTVALYVEHLNGSVEEIKVSPDDNPSVTFKNQSLQIVENWIYTFKNSKIGLNATFRFIYVDFHLPTQAYNAFDNIFCTMDVEGNKEYARKKDFAPHDGIFNHHMARIDITKYMWKQDVPQLITASVSLENV
jgi:hypothetical protein